MKILFTVDITFILTIITYSLATSIEKVSIKRGCDGIIGSGLQIDKCGVCGGEEKSCKYVEGLFRSQNLINDYQLVVRIPAGATRINIVEANRSRSCLALRSGDPDRNFLINGQLKSGIIDPQTTYQIAGTAFVYERPFESQKGESLHAEGPISIELDVLLYFQGENPGIDYEYTIPRSTATNHQTTNIVDRHENDVDVLKRHDNSVSPLAWSSFDIDGSDHENQIDFLDHSFRRRQNERLSYPSKSWLSPPRVSDTSQQRFSREEQWRLIHNHQLESRDRGNSRREAIWVNSFSSQGFRGTVWRRRGYGPCSKSCAGGFKTSLIRCVQIESNREVNDDLCTGTKPRIIRKRCNRQSCPAYYDVGVWSECTRTCGVGRTTRPVLCRQVFSHNFTTTVSRRKCRGRTAPETSERCQVKECAHWKIPSEWSSCSARCGSGTQTRTVVCATNSGETYPDDQCLRVRKPSSVRPCDAGPCITRWYFTNWEQCSANCNEGVQRRKVFCLNTAALPGGCPSDEEPASTRTCGRSSCGTKHEWFAGDWGKCSSECGSGFQERKVMCLSQFPDGSVRVILQPNERVQCETASKPATRQSCNIQFCGARWHYTPWSECSVSCGGGKRTRDVRCLDENGNYNNLCDLDTKPIHSERCNSVKCLLISNGNDPECKDRLSNCHLVLQAHFCTYSYYQTMCCNTCKTSLRIS